MGTVYKARQIHLDRVVALKVLPGGKSGDPQAVARLYREMKAVGRVDHPNIVRAMDAREIEGKPVLVMEYVEGVNLTDLARHYGKLPIAAACEIIRQAAAGLYDAHRQGLVHRDIKPSNIMLTPPVRSRFSTWDWPCSRSATARRRDDLRWPTDGHRRLHGPEQVSDAHAVDLRADIYSLGCTLYRLLTGEAPFSGPQYKMAFDKMLAHLQTPVPPVRNVRPEVSADLAAVLDRMLAKDPGQRFAAADEVVQALSPFAAGSDLRSLAAEAGRCEPGADTAWPPPILSSPRPRQVPIRAKRPFRPIRGDRTRRNHSPRLSRRQPAVAVGAGTPATGPSPWPWQQPAWRPLLRSSFIIVTRKASNGRSRRPTTARSPSSTSQ